MFLSVILDLFIVLIPTMFVAWIFEKFWLRWVLNPEHQDKCPSWIRYCDHEVKKWLGLSYAHSQNAWGYFSHIILMTVLSIVLILILLLGLELKDAEDNRISWLMGLNIAISFVTGTNWQAYYNEVHMTPMLSMWVMIWQQFVAPSMAIATLLVLIRGLSPQKHIGKNNNDGIGNFYIDFVRIFTWVMLPLSILCSIILLCLGTVQTDATGLAVLPITSQTAIKILGSNGGGYYSSNSAHPFDNPGVLSNNFQLSMMMFLPISLLFYFGQYLHQRRHMLCLFSVSLFYIVLGLGVFSWHERFLDGRDLRFLGNPTTLFNVLATATSCGATNADLESSSPWSILVLLVNMGLGEVLLGGVGTGLSMMVVFVLMTVFLSGLMVGRSPEYLGKKIEPFEMSWVTFNILIAPVCSLVLTAIAVGLPEVRTTLVNSGARGFTEIFYASLSTVSNNGSVLSGLKIDHPFWLASTAINMFLGRFLSFLPILFIAESLQKKKSLPPGLGTLSTRGWLFSLLLAAIMFIIGLLTYMPAFFLGPILEIVQNRT
jgi:K+-transporting ATPase ATPase A chain